MPTLVLSVTVGATTTNYQASEFPVTRTLTSGTSVGYTYSDPVASSDAGKRYDLTGTTGPASGFTVNSNAAINGSYATHVPALARYGSGCGRHGGQPSRALAMAIGLTAAPVVNLTADLNVAKATGERYHFSAWSGASTATTVATSVTMSAPRSLTANYGVQYQLTLGDRPGCVSTSHIAGASTGDWFDSGSTVDLTAD